MKIKLITLSLMFFLISQTIYPSQIGEPHYNSRIIQIEQQLRPLSDEYFSILETIEIIKLMINETHNENEKKSLRSEMKALHERADKLFHTFEPMEEEIKFLQWIKSNQRLLNPEPIQQILKLSEEIMENNENISWQAFFEDERIKKSDFCELLQKLHKTSNEFYNNNSLKLFLKILDNFAKI